MKRYILNILLFFLIVAVIDVCAGGLGDYLQTHAKGGMTKRTDDLVMKDSHDVVILGSSRARHHYDTPYISDTLGLDVYNAGYDGNGVVLAYGILEMILERYQPKIVLFDVEPAFDIIEYKEDNHHIRYISEMKPYYRHEIVGNIIKDVSNVEWYKVHSGLIRYNSNLVTMFLDNISDRAITTKGYAPLIGTYKQIPDAKEIKEETVDEFKLKYIEKLILTAQSHQVPIVFVASPKLGANTSLIMEPVKKLCEKYNVDFWNYYDDLIFQNPAFFKEPMHLNSTGALAYSNTISERIRKLVTK